MGEKGEWRKLLGLVVFLQSEPAASCSALWGLEGRSVNMVPVLKAKICTIAN